MTEKSSARANFGDTSSPQPPSNADFSGNGANTHGAYDSTRNGSPSLNGNGGGLATGKPCAGCVGRADNKNPQGQAPNGVAGADANAGYECDRNNGIGKTNPAHTGCVQQSVTPQPPTVTPQTPKPPTVTPQTPETPKPPTVTPQTPQTPETPETPKPPTVTPETPKPPTVTPETPKPPTVTPQTPVTPQQPTVTPPPSEVLGVTVVRTSTPAPAAPAAAAPTEVAATQLAATGSRAPYEAAVGLALLLIGLVAMALASERRQLA